MAKGKADISLRKSKEFTEQYQNSPSLGLLRKEASEEKDCCPREVGDKRLGWTGGGRQKCHKIHLCGSYRPSRISFQLVLKCALSDWDGQRGRVKVTTLIFMTLLHDTW